jgi:hypothetical protein
MDQWEEGQSGASLRRPVCFCDPPERTPDLDLLMEPQRHRGHGALLLALGLTLVILVVGLVAWRGLRPGPAAAPPQTRPAATVDRKLVREALAEVLPPDHPLLQAGAAQEVLQAKLVMVARGVQESVRHLAEDLQRETSPRVATAIAEDKLAEWNLGFASAAGSPFDSEGICPSASESDAAMRTITLYRSVREMLRRLTCEDSGGSDFRVKLEEIKAKLRTIEVPATSQPTATTVQ